MKGWIWILAALALVCLALPAAAQDGGGGDTWWTVALGIGAIVAVEVWKQFRGSAYWDGLSTKQQLVAQAIRVAVQVAYRQFVRQEKAKSPDGRLTPLARREAMSLAKRIARDKATLLGVDGLPGISKDHLLEGAIEREITEVKALAGARPARTLLSKGRPAAD